VIVAEVKKVERVVLTMPRETARGLRDAIARTPTRFPCSPSDEAKLYELFLAFGRALDA
jgi:hypothetical protein